MAWITHKGHLINLEYCITVEKHEDPDRNPMIIARHDPADLKKYIKLYFDSEKERDDAFFAIVEAAKPI